MSTNTINEGSGTVMDTTYINSIVDSFALAMKHKLLLNIHKGKPEPIPIPCCIDRLYEELEELKSALLDTNQHAVLMEAADVACFALFTALNFKGSNE